MSDEPFIEFGVGWAKVHFRRELTEQDRANLLAAVSTPPDTSDIPEADESFFTAAELRVPRSVREALESEVERWSADTRASYPATEVAESFARLLAAVSGD